MRNILIKCTVLIFLIIGMTSCKTQRSTIKNHIVSDTLITHTTEVLTLPTRTTTIIKEPCKDSVLQPINQTVKSGNTTAKILTENGSIKIEVETDTVKQVNNSKTSKHNSEITSIQTVTKSVTPKWAWYVLSYAIGATIWIFRKPILKLINPLW